MAMQRFRFRLDPLLRVRKLEENRALAKLAQVMMRVNEQEGRRDTANRLVREEMDSFSHQHSAEFSIDQFQLYDRYLKRLETEAITAGDELEAMRPELEKEQKFVMEARRRKRIVELLKERKRAEYDRDYQRAVRKELEEINRPRGDIVGPYLHKKGSQNYAGAGNKSRWAAERMDFENRKEEEERQERARDDWEDSRDPVDEYYKKLGIERPD